MINVSEMYKNIVKKTVRPKCEPVITVEGFDDVEQRYVSYSWTSSEITSLTFKRSIDPIGRELPYLELTWEEIYAGKLNAENYPEKYNNVFKFMLVKLSFEQSLSFYNTWKALKQQGYTWKTLLTSPWNTWKALREVSAKETIEMPYMFLEARPTVDGQTITWVARDIMHFLTNKENIMFNSIEDTDSEESATTEYPTMVNVISNLALNNRDAYLRNANMINSINATITVLLTMQKAGLYTAKFTKPIICDGVTNSLLMNTASVFSYYWDFSGEIMLLKRLFSSFENTGIVFDAEQMFEFPKITNTSNISKYDFKHYSFSTSGTEPTERTTSSYDETLKFHNDLTLYKFNTDGYALFGDCINITPSSGALIFDEEISRKKITVTPITKNSTDNSLAATTIGEAFTEDNPVNPYNSESEAAKARFEMLNKYFNSNCRVLEFSALPNLAVETGDIVDVETNLYQKNSEGEDVRIIKKAVVVEIELEYNGALTQKITAHEVTDNV